MGVHGERNVGEPYKEIADGIVSVRITSGYGVATNYCIENKCPKCGAKLVKVRSLSGCFDGEFTDIDEVSCENSCFFTYNELVPERLSKY